MDLMCCFSREVEKVWSTRIFARPLAGPIDASRQLVVYGMSFEAHQDLAMILPIPIHLDAGEDAVRFVDLSACPTFFEDLDRLFPVPVPRAGPPMMFALAAPQGKPMLVVHDVGDFEASFVPTPRDFDRLDPRFRLPGEVWDALPEYSDWGFCVFKLRRAPNSGGGSRSGLFGLFKSKTKEAGAGRKVHPMAFEFPRRDASSLFFPTVHVHDGRVHPTAEFDHELFCQTEPALEPLMDWTRSESKAVQLAPLAQRWVEPNAWLWKRTLSGEHPNRDTFLVESKLRARTAVSESFRLCMRAAWEHVVDDGKIELDAQRKKWLRVSEAERMRIRDAVVGALTPLFAERGEAWNLGNFAHDAAYVPFSAWNERVEPQELDVVFKSPPTAEIRGAVQAAFQDAIDRATR
jgi:hypothetical protein